jgi:hypothetical protein
MKPNYHIHHPSHIEKPKKEFTYSIAIAYGVVTELFLIVAQYVFLAINSSMNPEISMAFTTEYMMTRGFFVFQILGIIVYAVIVYQIVRKYTITSLAFMLVFLVAGALVELTFYVSIQATFQGAFFYSMLDKTIGAVLGAIVYYTLGSSNVANKV